MKSLIMLATLTIVSYSAGFAQFKQGQVELSFSGSLGSWAPPSTDQFKMESQTYMALYVMPGYYVLNGLSVEPEIGFMAMKNSTPSEYLILNLSYTYLIPDAKVAPYVRGGYGIGNSVHYPFMSIPIAATDKFNVGVLNLGAGAKFLISQDVIIRAEVNYLKHNWTEEASSIYYSYKYDYTMSTIGLLLGFSILL